MKTWETVCIIVWIASFLIGYYIGFTNMLARVGATILSAFVAFMLKDWAFAFLFQWALFNGNQRLAKIIVIIITILLLRMLLHLVLKMLGLVGRLPGLRKMNRLLGGAIGLVEGTTILLVIRYLLQL